MSDNLRKRDGRDRSKVNSHEPWEVADVARRRHVSKERVIEVIRKVGPVRARVEQELAKRR